MNPIRPQRLMVAPPTLEKQVDVVRAINALVTQYDDEQQQRRRADGAADRAAFEKLRRDCEALEQAMHDAYREAAQIILQSRARRRANAHGAVTDALRKRGYNPNEPRVPKHHTGGGEWTRNTVAAADNVSVRPGVPSLMDRRIGSGSALVPCNRVPGWKDCIPASLSIPAPT